MLTTEKLIAAAVEQFTAPRRQRFVHAAGRGVTVHAPGERILHLPNGAVVKVSVDDSGCATQIEEADALHAVARPRPVRLTFKEN